MLQGALFPVMLLTYLTFFYYYYYNTCFKIFREYSKVTCLKNDKMEFFLNVYITKKKHI